LHFHGDGATLPVFDRARMRQELFSQGLVLVIALTLSATSVSAGQRRRSGGPLVPYVDAGACPFEGCAYGEWTPTDTVKVRRERDRRSPVAFELAPGEKVTAVTGAVIVLRPGRVEFTAGTRLSSQDGVLRIRAGDTLYLLAYIGEGFTNAWLHGRLYRGVDGATSFFDVRCTEEPGRCSGRVVEPPLTEWWVQLRASDGRTGWTHEPEKFDGKNRLGV
jgi:hypothetical protein